jgi:hypothetical protein
MYKYADNIYCIRIEFGFEIYTTTTQSPVQNPVYLLIYHRYNTKMKY